MARAAWWWPFADEAPADVEDLLADLLSARRKASRELPPMVMLSVTAVMLAAFFLYSSPFTTTRRQRTRNHQWLRPACSGTHRGAGCLRGVGRPSAGRAADCRRHGVPP